MSIEIVKAISESGLTIYDSLHKRPELFIDNDTLQSILNSALSGLLLNQPLRTRSKVLKTQVCAALGYPVPKSFKKTQPRFPGQNFDTYVQKSNNLQIWNEEVSSSRRYVLIRVDANDKVTKVRVATGDVIAAYDTTGTLTQKYQAKSRKSVTTSTLVIDEDTKDIKRDFIPSAGPTKAGFLPIKKLYKELQTVTGTTIANPGVVQERNRGGSLHEAVCKCLGQLTWADNGQFPDIKEQLLEIKLQTSPTIDLGLVCPDSTDYLADMPTIRHCDVRYAVFYGTLVGNGVSLDHVVLTTGEAFFTFFQRFEGLVTNKKLQIPLPSSFFD
jgi:hypothetical protein